MSADQIQLAMASVNHLFNTEVIGKGNFDALDRVYTTDARILPPGAPMITGRENIKKFWRDLVQSVNATSAVLTSIEVIPAGDTVIEIGRATLSMPAAELDAKYVVCWRQEDGQWKWHVDIWNPNS